MPHSTPTVIGALLLALTPLAFASSSASAAAVRCDGKRATIVSGAEQVTGMAKRVTGTAKDDVIVVTGRGSAVVAAGAGDDTICLRTRGTTLVRAGNGDDTVLSQERRGRPDVLLGPGDDTYSGSGGSDLVRETHARGGRAGGVDTIRTRGGDDFVMIGPRRGANLDTVDLGSGDDSLMVVGKAGSGARLTGGPGTDVLSLYVARRARLAVDAQHGTATVADESYLRWSAFDAYELFAKGTQSFTGSTGDDTVGFIGPGSISATMGGGDDTVATSPIIGHAAGLVDGGEGDDALKYLTESDIVGDTTTGQVTAGGTTLTMASVERLAARTSGSVSLTGSDGNDDLRAEGCAVTLRGGAGNDHLVSGQDPEDDAFTIAFSSAEPQRCTAPTSNVQGEAGDDVLVGNDVYSSWSGRRSRPRQTVLDGGDGVDVAVGMTSRGRTTCIAETRVSCGPERAQSLGQAPAPTTPSSLPHYRRYLD
ncbi:hypothetical protein [Nocardioides sp. LHG3406-4]|uniref:hypothetical protein n=1 Tax=Nocardioides sp. LHG3406-4 TaxID=2804575 RepID=UPI003CF99519